MQAKPTKYLVPESTWEIDGQKGMTLRIDNYADGYYSFDDVKVLPKVVEYNGQIYRRTGWNSDTGEVFYKETSNVLVVRPTLGVD